MALRYASSGIGVGFTANASGARGRADGTDVTQTATTITAGNAACLSSGGDTRLNGAVVSGASVTADIGGNLNPQPAGPHWALAPGGESFVTMGPNLKSSPALYVDVVPPHTSRSRTSIAMRFSGM